MGRGLQVGGAVKRATGGTEAGAAQDTEVGAGEGMRNAASRMRNAVTRAKRRLAAWWRALPLGVTFALYVTAYLVVATAVTIAISTPLGELEHDLYSVEYEVAPGHTLKGNLHVGPYIYDAEADEILPAGEITVPGLQAPTVFVSLSEYSNASASEASGLDSADGRADDGDYETDGEGQRDTSVNATLDMARAGEVRLSDWGLNYTAEYTQEEILGENGEVTAENIAAYDRKARAGRIQSLELFKEQTGVDLAALLGENKVSNVAYYAERDRASVPAAQLASFLGGVVPFLSFGIFAIVFLRRFYRVHVSAPLAQLEAAAARIADQDLDFVVESADGREFGRLSAAFEKMRASLAQANRDLWHSLEERQRLNAAFAHDLRTPVTVLKGTLEMARLRAERAGGAGNGTADGANGAGADVVGDGAYGASYAVSALGADTLATLSEQVDRLERYASAMGGLVKLEDRPVVREPLAADALLARLETYAREVASAFAPNVQLDVAAAVEGSTDVVSPTVAPMQEGTAFADVQLIEEVLGNLINNACGHARCAVRVELTANIAPMNGQLTICVSDDGPGFSPEALVRACEPFYSEAKSAEHFGVGLNVSRVLAELHGGALTLANAEAGGAVATATFAISAA